MFWRRASRLLTVLAVVAVPIAAIGPMAPATAVATEVDMDPAWHGGTPFRLDTEGYTEAVAQVVDTDGSTYIVGDGTIQSFALGLVSKLDPAGNIDTTYGFGTQGLRGTDLFQAFITYVGGAALQPGHGLVIAGGQGTDWVVLRLDQFGALDPSFGSGGIVVLPQVGGQSFLVSDPPTVAVGADGKIVLAGYVVDAVNTLGFAVVRLDADGSVDQLFGSGGMTLVPVPRPFQDILPSPSTLRLDTSGRLILSLKQLFGNPILYRFTSAGGRDPSFGVAGVLDDPHRSLFASNCSKDFTLDPQGRILRACPHDQSDISAGVSRYQPDGTLDTSFGDAGTAHAPPVASGAGASFGQSLTLDGDRIILAGRMSDTSIIGTPTDYAIWRFTAGGQLDRSFGSSGGVIRKHDSISDDVQQIDALPDGRLAALIDTTGAAGSFEPHPVVGRLLPATSIAQPSLNLLDAPQRVLDTRIGVPDNAGKLSAGSVLTLPLVGRAGVRADTTAVALNVTVTEPEQSGYLTVYPCGQPPPVASNVNYVAGQTIPNLVVARLGAGGAVCIFSSQTTHVVADVTGSYGPNTDLHLLPAPLRLIDTRSGLGSLGPGKLGTSALLHPAVHLVQIPNSTWVNEAILNVTITEPDRAGYLTAYQCGTPVPLASNLNFVAGQTIANLVAVRLSPFAPFGPDRAICFVSTARTHLVVDLEATADIGAAELPVPAPTRLLDTRIGNGAAVGKIEAGVPLDLQIAGRANVATDATAVGLNVTVTEPDAAGYLTVYPCGQPSPLASNLNFVAGETIPNFVIARIGSGGKICMISNVSTHIVADVVEFYPTVS